MDQLTLLALSGSLRKKSYNTALNQALQQLAPDHVEIKIFDGMANIPLFNPDLEDKEISAVKNLKNALGRADGLILSSPEYAHGISGVMKNTLDWLVSGDEFVYKPVVFFNTSPRASHAQQALREVVKTMSGIIVDEASISVPLLGSDLDSQGIVNHAEISAALKKSINDFCAFILKNKAPFT